jgi:hypothetical protein
MPMLRAAASFDESHAELLLKFAINVARVVNSR